MTRHSRSVLELPFIFLVLRLSLFQIKFESDVEDESEGSGDNSDALPHWGNTTAVTASAASYNLFSDTTDGAYINPFADNTPSTNCPRTRDSPHDGRSCKQTRLYATGHSI
jgi:hypothetical protein